MVTQKKSLLKNIASVGIIQIANYIFPMVTIPIVSRIIGPDKFGVINFASSFVAYFILFIGFGFDLTATRKIAADPHNVENRNKVFSEVFFSQCLLLMFSIVLFAVSFLFIPQLKEEKQVAIFTFLMCFGTTMTQNWLFQAMQNLPKVALLNLISKVLFTVVVLLTIHEKNDYVWQPFALSTSHILVSGMSYIWSIRKYKLRLYAVSLSTCLKLLWDEKVFFFSLCVINLYTNTNIVVLGLFQSTIDVGYYTSAQKLIIIFQSLISIPLTQALFPYIGKAFDGSYNRGIVIAQKLIPIVFLLTFLSGILIVVGAPLFIKFFYGDAFAPAVTVCRILAFIPMLIALGVICGIHIMLNLKMDKIFFKVTCAGAMFSVLLNIIMVKQFGYIGSAITWIATEFFNLTLLFILLKRRGVHLLNWHYFRIDFYKKQMQTLKVKVSYQKSKLWDY